jgi:ComF family protein
MPSRQNIIKIAGGGYNSRVLLQSLLSDVANLIYPPFCVVCGQSAQEIHPTFCAPCRTEIDHLAAETCCKHCAAPLPLGASCPYCLSQGIHPFEKIVALGPFRKSLRKLIHHMKYHHRWPVAEILADRLLQETRAQRLLDHTERLVPVSLYWSRQIFRGYNQADALAQRIAQQRKIPLARSIVRVKNTISQTIAHSRQDRAENLRDAFGLVDPRSIHGKHITLVDDVMTTASTLKSAARALQPAEPASISVLVLAVADPRRRDFQTI